MKRVLILFGGKSSEHNVSCISASSIAKNIDNEKYTFDLVGISKENNWYLYNDDFANLNEHWEESKEITKIDNIIDFLKKYDVVFPITHGTNGEDGKLQGFLDLFGIKYVGAKTLGSSVGMDKEFSKIVFEHLKINQVSYLVCYKNFKIKEIEKHLDYPLIVKPANGGSSIGINKVSNSKELKVAINEALKYDKKVIIEKFIKAKELEIAILQDKDKLIISNVGEIIPCNQFYDYKAKYEQKSETKIPANINKKQIKLIKEIAKKIFYGMNISSYARIDFFIENENIYINEINTIPGFTEISMYPKLMEDIGIKYTNLITKLIENCF